jgi:hypothetical protein
MAQQFGDHPQAGRRADALDPPARRRDDHRQMASLGPEPPGRSRGWPPAADTARTGTAGQIDPSTTAAARR